MSSASADLRCREQAVHQARDLFSEWDRAFANGATPAGLHVLSASPTVSGTNHPDVSNTTYNLAPSGALVFATGSIYWARAQDSYRLSGGDKSCAGHSSVIPGMQKLMAQVMDALVIDHPRDS